MPLLISNKYEYINYRAGIQNIYYSATKMMS